MKQSKRRKRLHPNTLQLIRQIVGGVLVLILIGLIVTAVWYVTRLPALTLTTVQVSGGETIKTELVQQLVENELEGKYIGLVPKSFFAVYPEQSMIEIVKEIDRIKHVTIERSSLTSLLVTFEEYIPDALWCDRSGEKCVFLDSTGFAFAKAPSLSGGSLLRLDKLGVEPVTGIQAFSAAQYEQAQALVVLLEESNWFVDSVAIDAANDVYLMLTDGGELKAALDDSPEVIIDNLFTVVGSEEFPDLAPGEFAYIDLRFGNKVFVSEHGKPQTATSSDELLLE